MNNLLRTLTENQRRPSPDLKLLLNTVKDVRRLALDSKAADPFYESLEGLLYDLRTITMDNHDAEAFLKPVSRSDVPDYYEVISNPMDLQTMLKKVKAKQYKSKREFKDDLDLMWSNCFIYNSTEDHPLRHCAMRLKKKAERLLMNITDRRDRVDPPVPGDPSHHANRPIARPKLNGLTLHDRDRDTTPTHTLPPLPGATSSRHTTNGHSTRPPSITEAKPRKQVSFADSPALMRTQQGMSSFRDLDLGLAQLLDATDLQRGEPGPSTLSHAQKMAARLRHYTVPLEVDDEDAYSDNADSDVKMETLSDTGEKRKLITPYLRQAKRPRLTPPDSGDEVDSSAEALRPPNEGELIDLWWNAVQSDAHLANGLPCLPSIASFPPPLPQRPPRRAPITIPSATVAGISSAPTTPRKRRVRPVHVQSQSGTLLSLMNANVMTLKRVRRTHTKFTALGFNAGEDGAGTGAPGVGFGVGGVGAGAEREDIPDPEGELPEDVVDERPWLARLRCAGGKTVGRGGIEIGERAAGSCLKWMNRKVLEHVGFQGASSGALDVLTGVASEFFLNLGRTLRFLCDKYAHTMTSEEIILHALFESGITRIQDLERYIKDDIVRHGMRLAELEKKLENAYREATSTDVPDDDALFNSDQEEEDALAMGTFADTLGEDFLGLRELGIAAELGLSSLSVPRKLLKGKRDATGGVKAKPTEVLLPYPPPPPFLPITSKNVEDQIGLLRPYYHQRLSSLAVTAPVPGEIPNASLPGVLPLPPPPPPPSFPPLPLPGGVTGAISTSVSQVGMDPSNSQQPLPHPFITLPDDPPNPAQTKVGPTGFVTKPSLAASTVKKKAKGKEGAGAGTSGATGIPVTTVLQPEAVDGGGGVAVVDVGVVAGGGGGGGSEVTSGSGSVNVNAAGGSASPKKKARMVDMPPVIAARG
ncbi:hypothetical protein EDD17DRAFT_1529032 [Pisolithus thermaeus]|nr:hypothetical protein EDD17DRAFT_1529032 [Pisolithus thermaeus]